MFVSHKYKFIRHITYTNFANLSCTSLARSVCVEKWLVNSEHRRSSFYAFPASDRSGNLLLLCRSPVSFPFPSTMRLRLKNTDLWLFHWDEWDLQRTKKSNCFYRLPMICNQRLWFFVLSADFGLFCTSVVWFSLFISFIFAKINWKRDI